MGRQTQISVRCSSTISLALYYIRRTRIYMCSCRHISFHIIPRIILQSGSNWENIRLLHFILIHCLLQVYHKLKPTNCVWTYHLEVHMPGTNANQVLSVTRYSYERACSSCISSQSSFTGLSDAKKLHNFSELAKQRVFPVVLRLKTVF